MDFSKNKPKLRHKKQSGQTPSPLAPRHAVRTIPRNAFRGQSERKQKYLIR
jgi:hypothetical protein